MPKVSVEGGGCSGFDAAWQPGKRLRRGGPEVVAVDPRPCRSYQPFRSEVTAGSMKARHAAVSLQSVQHPGEALTHGGVPRVHR